MDLLMGCTKLHELFSHTAALYPHNIAVEFYDDVGKQQLTYKNIHSLADTVEQLIVLHIYSKRHVFSDNADNIEHAPSCFSNNNASANVIGIYVDECCFLPGLVIGVLKAGFSFMPLNCSLPKILLCNQLVKAKVRFVITTSFLKERFLKSASSDVIVLGSFSFATINCSECSFVLLHLISNRFSINNEILWHLKSDMAYVLSTSGTTGDPKMVFVPHQCILSNIQHLRQVFMISTKDKVAMCSPLTFDPSIVEIFLALSCGATLVIVSNSIKCKPSTLLKTLFISSKVSVMQCTPTLFNRFPIEEIQSVIFAEISSLRLIAFGGESCPSCSTIKNWLGSHYTNSFEKKELKFFNIYGITEVSSWSTLYNIKSEELLLGNDCPISLGYPLLNTVLDIIDKDEKILCQIASTLSNENFIKMDYLSWKKTATKMTILSENSWSIQDNFASLSGYLRIGGVHRTCFIDNVEDVEKSGENLMRKTGDLVKLVVSRKDYECINDSNSSHDDVNYSLYYLGRSDNQIKRHGKRMNLLSVKYKLDESDLVAVSHVMNIDLKTEFLYSTSTRSYCSNSLVAFIVPNENKKEIKSELFAYLRSILERHQVPDELVLIEKLPMTDHGKVDELALKFYFKPNFSVKDLCETDDDIRSMIIESWMLALNQTIGNNRRKCSQSDLNSNFIECGGDSLAAVNLAGKIEKTFRGKAATKNFNMSHILNVILHGTLNDIIKLLTSNQSTSYRLPLPTSFGLNKEKCQSILNCPTIAQNRKRSYASAYAVSGSKEIKVIVAKNISYFTIGRGNIQTTHGTLLSPYVSAEFRKTSQVVDKISSDIIGFAIKEIWSYNTHKCIDASPLIVFEGENKKNGFVVTGSHSHLLVCVHISSGLPQWTIELNDRIESSPCLTPCGQYIAVGCYDGCVYVVSANTGQLWWKFETGDQVKSSPCPGLFKSSYLFVGSHDGYLYCLDAKTRKLSWRYYSGGAIFSSPRFYQPACKTLDASCVYGCSLSGNVFSLESEHGKQKWSVKLEKPVFSSPLVCDLGLSVGCVDNNIYMLDKDNGDILWQFATGQPVFSSPALSRFRVIGDGKPVVLCGSHDGRTYCVDGKDGTLLWSSPGSDQSQLSPVYATPFPATVSLRDKVFNVVFSVATDGVLSVLDLHDGKILNRHKLPGPVFSSPVVIEQEDKCLVVVGCRNDYLYCLELKLL